MPASITIIAILGLLYGILGFIMNPLEALVALVGMQQESVAVFGMETPMPQYEGVTLVLHTFFRMIGFLLSIMLLSGAVGTIMMRAWARSVMRWWAGLYILNTFVSQLFTALLVFPEMADQMPAGMGPEADLGPAGAVISAMLGFLCGLLCFSLYPIAVLIFYSTETARRAFEEAEWRQYGGMQGQQAPQQDQYGQAGQWQQYGGYGEDPHDAGRHRGWPQPHDPYAQMPQPPPPPGQHPGAPPPGGYQVPEHEFRPPPPIEGGPEAFEPDEEDRDERRRD